MGALLMQFEYMRAKQKYTVLQREGIRLSDKHELYQKRIEKIQTAFGKRKTSTTSLYDRKISQWNSSISGVATSQPGLASLLTQLSGWGISVVGSNTASDASVQAGLNDYLTETAGTYTVGTDAGLNGNNAKQIQAMNNLASQLKIMVQEILEAQKEEALACLEESEAAQLEPIEMKDNEISLKLASNEVLTTMTEERMNSAKNRLPNILKDAVAHYGFS